MNKLELIPLKETTIQLIDGDRGVNYPNKKAFSSDGYCLFLDSSNLTKNGFDFSTKVFITKEKDNLMGNGKVKYDDLVMNTRGTIGNIGHFTKEVPYKNIRINSGMLIIRGGKDFLNQFIYGYFRSNLFFSQVKNMMSGSVQNQLPVWAFNFIKVPKIGLSTQKKIASTLASIDAKIEVNNKINTALAAMAKTLYDYWFVQFDFPNEQGKPYKSSGGQMIYNEEVKREIPKGWGVDLLSDCCNIIDCLHSKKPDYIYENEDTYLLQLENIRDNGLLNLNKKYYVKNNEYERWTERIEVQDHDLLITNAGRVAATAQIPKGILTGIGRNITAIRPTSIYPTYLFQAFQGEDMRRQILWNTDTGSFFKSLNVKGIKLLYIARSISGLEEQFEKIVLPMRRKREQNQVENQLLTELRDWLLPMLMNGQVNVKGAKEV